jgi:hypothetical protein
MHFAAHGVRFLAVLLASGCAAAPHRASDAPAARCEFAVYNRTPHALEVRVEARPGSTTPIGALNPSELLTHAVPCGWRHVWVVGVPIPMQIGGPVSFRFVQAEAALIEGERVEIDLHWP